MSPSEALQRDIRAARPIATRELRERVRALAALEPARQPFLARFAWRRLVLVAPATVVVALVAAGVIGLTRDDVSRNGDRSASAGASTVENGLQRQPRTRDQDAAESSAAPSQGAPFATPVQPNAAIAPDPGRVQRYAAELQVRVENLEALSRATQRAQRIAASLGGNVSSLSYNAPRGGIGSANIVLRIPIGRVQTAMTQLSQLGTILGQRFGVEDLQPAVDDLSTQVEQAQRRIARITRQLRNTSLLAEERAVLRSRLATERARLGELRAGLSATRAEGRFATVSLTLTTEEVDAVVPAGRESKLDGIKDVLVWEGVVALYALVVAGPILLLGVLLWLALRLRRRQQETRLLEQS